MATSVFNPERGDQDAHKATHLAKIKSLEDGVAKAGFLEQRKSLQKSLVIARQDYYNFLLSSGKKLEADYYVSQHPEIDDSQPVAS